MFDIKYYPYMYADRQLKFFSFNKLQLVVDSILFNVLCCVIVYFVR